MVNAEAPAEAAKKEYEQKIKNNKICAWVIISMGGSCGELSIAGLRSKIFAQEVPLLKYT
jgi:hypothetical protein